MDPEISEQLHEHIFQTYNQLKTVLPKEILKIKVLKKQRYPIIKQPLMNEIEKDIISKNKNYSSSAQKINIFYNENMRKKSQIQNLFKKNKINMKKQEIEKSNSPEATNRMFIISKRTPSLYDNSEIITYKNFREKNMKMLGVNCDTKMKRTKGMYNSFSVNDIDMKKNIYLPRIIDRMKYSVPRNLRNNQGLIILGMNAKNIVDKNKEITFIKKKKTLPTDIFFYKLKKINKRNDMINKKDNFDNNNNINNANKLNLNMSNNFNNSTDKIESPSFGNNNS